MNADAALLRRYLDERSESAFAALVHRHLGLVYAVALRRCPDDPRRAAAIAQEVFSQLAREAGPLSRRGLIAAWLHGTTLRTAAGFPPAGAAIPPPNAAATTAGETPADRDGRWDSACDEALDELPEADRAALLIHLFQQRGLPELGAELNLSVEAARICVGRALDKLRAVLTRRGNRMGPTALRDLLARQAPAAAPAGLVERIAGAAVAGARVAGEAGGERPSFFASLAGMINSGAALGAAAAIIITAVLAWGYRTNVKLEAEINRLRGESQVIAARQRENRRLALLVAEAAELRREVAELPALRAAMVPAGPQPPAGSVVLTVTAQGTLRWEQDDISPGEFIHRIQDFRRRHPAPDTMVVVRGTGAPLSAVAWVLDGIRRAQITTAVVEGDTRPDEGRSSWF
jgi:DNA-directed RNA polymerase specialized sigma24 family protein/biopolymer transport protein ExbD